MATTTGKDSPSQIPSRESAHHVSMPRRPKLTRSSATAPSLATSTASRKDLASLKSSSRAATLLTRVASYSPTQDKSGHRTSSPDRRRASSPLGRPPGTDPHETERKKVDQMVQGTYFSFPSFEDFIEAEANARGADEQSMNYKGWRT